jgi:hypothetical protein
VLDENVSLRLSVLVSNRSSTDIHSACYLCLLQVYSALQLAEKHGAWFATKRVAFEDLNNSRCRCLRHLLAYSPVALPSQTTSRP